MKQGDLFQEMPLEQRAQLLADNAYFVQENEMYQKPLSKEEIEAYKCDLVETTIKIKQDKAELKDVSKVIKESEKVRDEAAEAVQFGSLTVTGEVYQMDDQEAGLMHLYASDGVYLSSRPLKPNERQMSIRTAAANL